MVSNSAAVSPMPMEELKLGHRRPFASFISFTSLNMGRIIGLESTRPIFNPAVLKSDVLEKTTILISIERRKYIFV